MKRLFMLLLVSFIWCTSFAQQVKSGQTVLTMKEGDFNRTEEYCLIVGTSKLMSQKVNIDVDFGQERKWMSRMRLVDENGQPITLESMVDALNYMNGYGWEFVNAYTITMGSTNVYHFLLKRPFQRGEN